MTLVNAKLGPEALAGATPNTRFPESSILTIFGAAGDLTKRKLIPALYSLAHDGLLPEGQTIVGFARSTYSDEEFRKICREACDKFARRRPTDDTVWEKFAAGLFYIAGDFQDPAVIGNFKNYLADLDAKRGTGGRRIFYFSVAPHFFPVISTNLGQAGMLTDPEVGGPFTRAIIEKPFGRDLETAKQLNKLVVGTFRERQVFRIDHYLGKETVQNILVLRFANSIFEPFWNRQYIDHVQMTVAEQIGVEGRGGYFETSGITRDIIQNHQLQLLSLIAMEPPAAFEANAVRDEKVKVISALRPFPIGEKLSDFAVRGQYSAGLSGDKQVPAYRQEESVAPESRTETYAALKVFVDNWRWADVPFYLRAGKRLPQRVTEIQIQFRQAPGVMFKKMSTFDIQPNVLLIRIQPDEGIALKFDSKVPGATLTARPVTMEFNYAEAFGAEPPEAYERLLLDTMFGDSTLFARRDEVETAWSWLDPLMRVWESDQNPPALYEAGSWGPKESDEMLARDGRSWVVPTGWGTGK
ncbi:MAG TPA: glucose-6-phosphate dehydrogenase [Thermoanaerobaculia bacterium]|nr:glucose-6-phosphate dehydrogenase [Thermoanaerobaculia bacterium]